MARHNQISVLGSTGSIGENTLNVISQQPDHYAVFALSANKNIGKLYAQCCKHRPQFAVVSEQNSAKGLRLRLDQSGIATEVLAGQQALIQIAADPDVDIVMAGIVGSAGLTSTLAAIDAGKKVLIANKEPIVMAGEFLLDRARRSGARILPVDSEHNAIMQCLPGDYCAVNNNKIKGIRRILLTGSGGPFRTLPLDQFSRITPEQACAHPNWEMGRKISVDSATMMNKALELIEACTLFAQEQSNIEIVVHPQSIVHSMVEYIDGSVLAQMGSPDMRIPIASALAWPGRIDSGAMPLDFFQLSSLEFEQPDYGRYPSLNLVRQVIKHGGTAPTVMNAANEIAVDAFLQRRITFPQIVELVEKSLQKSDFDSNIDLESVINADTLTRTLTNQLIH